MKRDARNENPIQIKLTPNKLSKFSIKQFLEIFKTKTLAKKIKIIRVFSLAVDELEKIEIHPIPQVKGKFASRGGKCKSGGGDVWGRSAVIFQIATQSIQPPTFCPRRRKRRPPPPTLPPTHRPPPSIPPVFAGTRGGSRLLTRNQVI